MTDFFLQIEKWKVLVACILLWANYCFAQENIRFERISANEGLSQSDIKCMAQDKLGFLWVGTRDGLNKYDGFEFHRYERELNDSSSLHFNQILDIQVDLSGNIWIGSVGGVSVYNYNQDNFRNFLPEANDLRGIEVNHILLTSQNTALLSTNKGLVNFDLNQGRFFIDEDLLTFKDVKASYAYQTQISGLWVGTDRGLFNKVSTTSGWVQVLENKSVQHIYFDPNGKVYVSALQGLFEYDLNEKRIEQIALPPGASSVIEVLRAQNGDLWVACNKVVILDKDDVPKRVLEHDKFNNYSLSEDRARVLFQTRDGIIWVGTFGYGLNKFNPDVAKFSYLSEQTSIPLSGNYVSTIFTADDSSVWVGTSRGLDVINLQSRSARHFSRNNDLFQIFKIILDQKRSVWITTSEGLMLYANNELVPKNSVLRSVIDLAEWDDANLILASRGQGIYLFDRKSGRSTTFISTSDLPEEVSCLLVEGDQVWIGCKDGLKLFNRNGQLMQQFRADSGPGSLHSSFIKCIYRDASRNLWVGTWGGGLSLFNAKDSTFNTFTTNNGLPNNVVYGILEDHSGILWLSTNLGLSAFNQKDHTFRNFDFRDGLQGNEFNTGAHFKSAKGKLYFGGVNGLSFFDPEEVLVTHPVPAILTTSIVLNNKPFSFQEGDSLRNMLMVDNIRLGWEENDIGVEFTAVDFREASTRHFQYSVRDEEWYDIRNRRSLELLDLASGSHEIQVRTKSPEENWSEPSVLLAIYIVPPLWERTWFRIIAFLTLLVISLGVYRYRIARLKGMNMLLNRLVRERTKEIQTKNEEIATQNDQLHEMNNELQTFSYSVSHDLRAPLRSVLGYSKMIEEDYKEKLDDEGRHMLHVIQQNATRMNNLIGDLLEFSKLGTKEPQKSAIDTSVLVTGILDQINTSTHHKAEIKLSTLPSTYADNNLLSQVWMNLISNAIKYSSKKETPVVEIGSYNEGNEIVFYVKDNGAGFEMKYVDKLFNAFQRLHKVHEFEGTGIGLSIVHRIVTQHKGRVWAEGKVDEGATFYFSLPSV